MNSAHSRFAYLLAASMSCVALLLVLSRSGWPQDAKGVERIKELQKQRVSVLEEAHEIINSQFRSRQESFEIAVMVEKDVLSARLAVAENQQERIKACDAAIDNVKEILKYREALASVGKVSKSGVFAAKSLLLYLQIERHKAEAGH
jgi:hypothetical protein